MTQQLPNHNETIAQPLATSTNMKIKSTLILICLICFVNLSCGQEKVKIIKSDNNRLIKILNNSEQIGENRENYLSVRIYKIDNGSGSAGIEEGHEVSHNLLIAVSEFDEEPNQSLFEIGPFYNPKFVKWIGKREYQKEFEMEYGAYDNRKSVILKVNINELKRK